MKPVPVPPSPSLPCASIVTTLGSELGGDSRDRARVALEVLGRVGGRDRGGTRSAVVVVRREVTDARRRCRRPPGPPPRRPRSGRRRARCAGPGAPHGRPAGPPSPRATATVAAASVGGERGRGRGPSGAAALRGRRLVRRVRLRRRGARGRRAAARWRTRVLARAAGMARSRVDCSCDGSPWTSVASPRALDGRGASDGAAAAPCRDAGAGGLGRCSRCRRRGRRDGRDRGALVLGAHSLLSSVSTSVLGTGRRSALVPVCGWCSAALPGAGVGLGNNHRAPGVSTSVPALCGCLRSAFPTARQATVSRSCVFVREPVPRRGGTMTR